MGNAILNNKNRSRKETTPPQEIRYDPEMVTQSFHDGLYNSRERIAQILHQRMIDISQGRAHDVETVDITLPENAGKSTSDCKNMLLIYMMKKNIGKSIGNRNVTTGRLACHKSLFRKSSSVMGGLWLWPQKQADIHWLWKNNNEKEWNARLYWLWTCPRLLNI